MALKRVYSVRKKQPRCRRNTISTLREVHVKPPEVGDVQIYKGQKLTVTKVFHKPKIGILIEYSGKGTDVGVCLAHYWWDKIKESKDSNR
jgi:hypothetical protein